MGFLREHLLKVTKTFLSVFSAAFLANPKKETLIFVPKKISKFYSMAFLVSLPHLFGIRKPLKDATDDNKDYGKIPIL